MNQKRLLLVQNDLSRLSRRLGHEFKSLDVLKQALTHCSANVVNNERLEFLGDSILNFLIAKELFSRFPEEDEGELSRLRALLVKGECLAEIALELQLGDFLYLGQGELKSGGFRRASILADALEAIIAAVYVDAGMTACETLIHRLYFTRLNDPLVLKNKLKDAKSQLQEWLQAHKKPLPQYTLINVEGQEHDQIFHIACKVEGITETILGQGVSRRKAEQAAARLILHQLNLLKE